MDFPGIEFGKKCTTYHLSVTFFNLPPNIGVPSNTAPGSDWGRRDYATTFPDKIGDANTLLSFYRSTSLYYPYTVCDILWVIKWVITHKLWVTLSHKLSASVIYGNKIQKKNRVIILIFGNITEHKNVYDPINLRNNDWSIDLSSVSPGDIAAQSYLSSSSHRGVVLPGTPYQLQLWLIIPLCNYKDSDNNSAFRGWKTKAWTRRNICRKMGRKDSFGLC